MYVIWSTCLLFRVNPPESKIDPDLPSWEELDAMSQARMIAYYQTREHEDFERAKVGLAARM